MAKRILLIDDDVNALHTLERYLVRQNYIVTTAQNGEEGLLALVTDHPDVVISDVHMPGISGIELLDKIQEKSPDTIVILITAHDDVSTAITVMQKGAYDYLTKPLDLNRLRLILERLITIRDLSARLSLISEKESSTYELDNLLVGHDEKMRDIYKTIGSVTRSRVTVLITGESGTGKELIAKAIHYNSPWRNEPFIPVNCTALTETLLESELFGHVKGSFTGALTDKRGKFELAGEGTIFLDEIGEISQNLQVKLLRVLQEREFDRVGGDKPIPMQARLISATNRDLDEEMKKGRIREDFFYRLNVVSIHVPPLRQRREDIPALVEHLLWQINHEMHTNVTKVSESAMRRILSHDWPGNVRELKNVLTRAVVFSKSHLLDEETLPLITGEPHRSFDEEWRRSLDEVEREHVLKVLRAVKGNRSEAARILGISKPTLLSKIPREILQTI